MSESTGKEVSSKIWDFIVFHSGSLVLFVLSIGVFITGFIYSKYNIISSNSEWDIVKNNTNVLFICIVIGTFTLSIANIYLFRNSPRVLMMFISFLACIVLGISYATFLLTILTKSV